MSWFDHLPERMAWPRQSVARAVRDLQTALFSPPGHEPQRARIKSARLRRLVPLWLFGAAMLAFATWARLQIGLNATTSVLIYLIIIVLLSLMDSAMSSIIFSVIAVGCLNYFFFAPVYSFEVGHSQDVIALFAFLFTSLAITGLVRRVRDVVRARREQACFSISRMIQFLSAIPAT